MKYINKIKFKTNIITAAETIISDQGYQNLSLRKISSELGCAVGSLYNSYQNLDEIYLRVNQRTLLRLHQLLKYYLINSNENFVDQFLYLSDIYIHFCESNYQLANCLFNYSQPEKISLAKWAQDDADELFKTLFLILESSNIYFTEDHKTIIAVLCSGFHGFSDLCLNKKSCFDLQSHFGLALFLLFIISRGLLLNKLINFNLLVFFFKYRIIKVFFFSYYAGYGISDVNYK